MIECLQNKKWIIGMVHLDPLPGSVHYSGDLNKLYQKALKEAMSLKDGGIDGIMIENAGDLPFPKKLDPVQIASMAVITDRIRERTGLPVGIDAAFCDYKAALSAAKASGSDFVRLAVFVDTVVTAQGLMEACSADAVRYRHEIGADDIKILADIQVKYSYPILSSISIVQSARNAQANMADAVIVTGKYSGNETPIDIVKQVKEVVSIPVFVGSGLNEDNAHEQMDIADGAIVGTSLKSLDDGDWLIDSKKVQRLMKNVKETK
ncbi:photosystem I assembly BtpA [Atopobacter sp. AH10]|uniref:BtpA/SgcQ family protein n=1 Tax=Atopobacter sp. AH10 TaxID=2315861 RepID=UPI000EF1A427|nr:BtpA/SgcQ family protein [Atopobacter sp. AH10]RLK63523.1 photosystem I assembly BtpA [Atopobacter sp. AH10]